jgi:putative component of toxin-antitoxin plasmid stabilization module
LIPPTTATDHHLDSRASVLSPASIRRLAGIRRVANAVDDSGTTLRSRIGSSRYLTRAAERAGKSDQVGIDLLTAQLARGNLNPGSGTRHVFGNVFEARARGGARVYFRNRGRGVIEILAKSTKKNQKGVIAELQRLYGN